MKSLIEEAKKATFSRRIHTNMDRWLPVAVILRGKGCSWAQIYDWLKAKDEPVQENKGSFIASMSRHYKKFINRAANKEITR